MNTPIPGTSTAQCLSDVSWYSAHARPKGWPLLLMNSRANTGQEAAHQACMKLWLCSLLMACCITPDAMTPLQHLCSITWMQQPSYKQWLDGFQAARGIHICCRPMCLPAGDVGTHRCSTCNLVKPGVTLTSKAVLRTAGLALGVLGDPQQTPSGYWCAASVGERGVH